MGWNAGRRVSVKVSPNVSLGVALNVSLVLNLRGGGQAASCDCEPQQAEDRRESLRMLESKDLDLARRSKCHGMLDTEVTIQGVEDVPDKALVYAFVTTGNQNQLSAFACFLQ